MIKVNLLDSLGVGQAGVSGDIVSTDIQRQAAVKIIIVLLFPLMLFLYEKFNLSVLETTRLSIAQKLESIKTKSAAYGEAGPRYQKYSRLKEKIDKEAETIRILARTRLREVKALDALQSLTPSQVWLSRISLKGNLVDLDGYSNGDEGIASLFAAITDSPVFSRFEPGAQTEEIVNGNRVKKFTVQFQIGRQESVSNQAPQVRQ